MGTRLANGAFNVPTEVAARRDSPCGRTRSRGNTPAGWETTVQAVLRTPNHGAVDCVGHSPTYLAGRTVQVEDQPVESGVGDRDPSTSPARPSRTFGPSEALSRSAPSGWRTRLGGGWSTCTEGGNVVYLFKLPRADPYAAELCRWADDKRAPLWHGSGWEEDAICR